MKKPPAPAPKTKAAKPGPTEPEILLTATVPQNAGIVMLRLTITHASGVDYAFETFALKPTAPARILMWLEDHAKPFTAAELLEKAGKKTRRGEISLLDIFTLAEAAPEKTIEGY